jgi:hypothetical protein
LAILFVGSISACGSQLSGSSGAESVDGGAGNGGASPDASRGGAATAGGSAGSGGAGAAGGGGAGGHVEPPDPEGSWRSALYPRGWQPLDEGGRADAEGRFLHDFSYAGYERGEAKPPYGAGSPVATVDATLGNGTSDATAGIQSAIDSACAQGGGVVRLPAGTYRVRLPTADAFAAVTITCSGLVLRGDGPKESRIVFDDAERARSKAAIAIRSTRGTLWDSADTPTYALANDVLEPTRVVELASTDGLAVGDIVVLRNDTTNAFRIEHRMDAASTGEATDFWLSSQFRGLSYPRRIVKLNGNEVTLDAPTRYPLKTRDNSRLYVRRDFLEKCGIEKLCIGMVQSGKTPTGSTDSATDNDYQVTGTPGYDVHASRAIDLDRVHDSWLYEVESFVPAENTASGVHVLSNGIQLAQAAFRITVERCHMGRPQYRGGGGNGYLFHVMGSDNLFTDSSATAARHGFIINQAVSGNVFVRVTAKSSRYSDDSHRFLAQANLYDNVTLDQAFLQAVNRGSTSTGGGFTATSHVFWNTQVVRSHGSAQGCAVETAQWAHGYAIGSVAAEGQTAKLCPESFSNNYWKSLDSGEPADFVEGEHLGATLHPASLYDAQLALRCARESIACSH